MPHATSSTLWTGWKAREGLLPHMFVDVRYRRTGRASGFKGDAFESLLGRQRYRWMRTLGNSSIGTVRRKIRISCPMAADQLLDLALDAAERRMRVIYFCACESPWRLPDCHRLTVAGLLSRAASRRGVKLEVPEWPGGKPALGRRTLAVSPETLRAVQNGADAVPLNMKRVPADWASLPWGTVVELKAGSEVLPVPVGPASYRRNRWALPLFDDGPLGRSVEVPILRRQVQTLRRRYRL